MAGQPFRAGLTARWVPAKGFRSFHSPLPGFAWRTEILVVARHELRTRRSKHRIIAVSSDSYEPKSKARCRSDIAVGIPHENDPIELLLTVKSRSGDRDMSNLFAFCGIVCERSWQSNHGNARALKLEQRRYAPSAGRSRSRP